MTRLGWFVLIGSGLLFLACAHGFASSWNKPNPPDAGTELRWGE